MTSAFVAIREDIKFCFSRTIVPPSPSPLHSSLNFALRCDSFALGLYPFCESSKTLWFFSDANIELVCGQFDSDAIVALSNSAQIPGPAFDRDTPFALRLGRGCSRSLTSSTT